MAYLIRVRLADQPGALGRLATALGAAGADIESVAVVDRGHGEAVDDLVVSLPPPRRAEALVTAVSSTPGCTLESIQPHPGRARVHDELALLDTAASSAQPIDVLVQGLPDLLAVRYAIAVDVDGGIVAATSGAPDQRPLTGWLPLDQPRVLTCAELYDAPAAAGPDAALAAAPVGRAAAIVCGRNGGADFRPAELLRLAHLANLVRVALRDERVYSAG
jgi:hypothetical protein